MKTGTNNMCVHIVLQISQNKNTRVEKTSSLHVLASTRSTPQHIDSHLILLNTHKGHQQSNIFDWSCSVLQNL